MGQVLETRWDIGNGGRTLDTQRTKPERHRLHTPKRKSHADTQLDLDGVQVYSTLMTGERGYHTRCFHRFSCTRTQTFFRLVEKLPYFTALRVVRKAVSNISANSSGAGIVVCSHVGNHLSDTGVYHLGPTVSSSAGV